MVPMNHGWLWFPNRPGLVSGIIIGGFGIGTFIFNFVCTALVNPDNLTAVNEKFPEEVNQRVPKMMLVLTLSNICIVLLALVLIFPGRDPTSQKEVKQAILMDLSHALTSEENNDDSIVDLEPLIMGDARRDSRGRSSSLGGQEALGLQIASFLSVDTKILY
jgi:hypothetical protein